MMPIDLGRCASASMAPMSNPFSFPRRVLLQVSYAFDRTMSAGPIALIGWLALASLIVIFIAAGFLAASHIAPPDSGPLSFIEAFWETTMRTIDPGNVGGDNGWSFRLVMLAVTLWGVFVVSALIGLLSAGVQERLDELRKGRSLVLERDHTVILNWSEAIFDVITELMVAHEDDGRFCMVILADKDKVEMEDAIAAKIKQSSKFRIVCRRGDPGNLADLAIANLEHAKAIIALSPDSDDPDSENLKTLLAIVHGPGRRAAPYQIAAEFRNAHNAEVARLVGGAEVQTILADDLISRIVVHTGRHVGLSGVYLELLNFEGSEIYVVPRPEIVGKSFLEAALMFEQGALIGLCQEGERIRLNPAADTRIEPDDLAVLVAEDRKRIAPRKASATADTGAILAPSREVRQAERALILGWNHRGASIVRQMTRYMAPGSTLVIAANSHRLEKLVATLTEAAAPIPVEAHIVDTRDRAALEALQPSSFNHVLVLAQTDTLAAQAADTATLVTLLHLRHIAERDKARFTVVSEIADVRNRELADVTQADDFVVSHRLVSSMLAQASENKYVSRIFDELLSSDGSEIYMRPVNSFVSIDRPLDFYTITEAALRRGETALGYCRRRGGTGPGQGAVVLNPRKSDKVEYREGDLIVVLAED
jgi:voltage-gated potassium channel Kch